MFKISQGKEIERPAEVVWPYLARLRRRILAGIPPTSNTPTPD